MDSEKEEIYMMQLYVWEMKKSTDKYRNVFSDIEKAFDVMWVEGLLIKIKELSITGKMFKLIQKLFVKKKNTSSNRKRVSWKIMSKMEHPKYA